MVITVGLQPVQRSKTEIKQKLPLKKGFLFIARSVFKVVTEILELRDQHLRRADSQMQRRL